MFLRRLYWPQSSFWSRHRRSRLASEADPLDSLAWPHEPDNPFDRIRRPAQLDELFVALHAPSLDGLSAEEAFVVGQIAHEPGDWGILPFAVGTGPSVPMSLATLAFVPIPPDREEGRIDWGDGSEWRSGLGDLEVTLHQLRFRLRDGVPSTAHDALGANGIGAHIIVTKDPNLLSIRETEGLREINLLTPLEAGVAIGAWARGTGRGGAFAHWAASDFVYYWALTRTITPSGWPAFAAFIHGNRVFPDGRRIEALAQSVLTRIDFLVEALDRLYITWQSESTNPAIEEIASLVDSILLRGWAIQDNIALLVSAWFGVPTDYPGSVSIHDSSWRRSIRRTGQAGRRMVDVLQKTAAPLKASVELRHHAVHRESLGAVNFHGDDGIQQARLFIPTELATGMRASLFAIGEKPTDWGMGDTRTPAIVHHSVDHGGGLVEEFDEASSGGIYLEPMAFAARFVASIVRLADRAFETLAPANDPRLPDPLRARALEPTTEHWASPEIARRLEGVFLLWLSQVS